MCNDTCFQREAIIAVTITDDEQVETSETFKVNLVRVIGGARLGGLTSVTVSIPPNDSPLGRFGFQELEVSLNYIYLRTVKLICGSPGSKTKWAS